MLLGCIGDDFTGSSDLANTLAKQGMRTVQYSGVPSGPADIDVQAGVVALKTRSIAPKLAVEQSLAALNWLRQQGCQQFFFKYCSTFDSTNMGNIGPVAEALADALDATQVVFCPAFPGAGRSVYQGHLFVSDRLLNESGMENHPLTPMKDADLRRVLAAQSKGSVGHVDARAVFSGSDAIRSKLAEQAKLGHRLIVVDALQDADLMEIGRAVAGLALLTGGSGVALGLPANFGISKRAVGWQGIDGKCVALSGSCSVATRKQVAHHAKAHPTFEITAEAVMAKTLKVGQVVDWLLKTDGLPLAYSSADPAIVAAVQKKFGRDETAQMLEQFFADVAVACVKKGVSKVLTAGGETSGAVVEALNLQYLQIGPEIDPGVPALKAGDELAIALKSGNFGSVDYFEKAAKILAGNT